MQADAADACCRSACSRIRPVLPSRVCPSPSTLSSSVLLVLKPLHWVSRWLLHKSALTLNPHTGHFVIALEAIADTTTPAPRGLLLLGCNAGTGLWFAFFWRKRTGGDNVETSGRVSLRARSSPSDCSFSTARVLTALSPCSTAPPPPSQSSAPVVAVLRPGEPASLMPFASVPSHGFNAKLLVSGSDDAVGVVNASWPSAVVFDGCGGGVGDGVVGRSVRAPLHSESKCELQSSIITYSI